MLGVGVSALTLAQAVDVIAGWCRDRERHWVCVTGVHGVMESQRDAELRAIHNRAGMVTPDGMPLVWLSRLRGHRATERVYGPDLLLAVCAHAAADGSGAPLRHFFYGGGDGVADRLAERLTARYPGLVVAGTYTPPFRPLTAAEEAEVCARIDGARADVVWVGLSTPKQERWMAAFRDKLQAPVLIGVGAAFDFHAGLKRQAPRWMQRSGTEWLFRLGTEPRRLWRRYLYNNPMFVTLLVLERLGLYRPAG